MEKQELKGHIAAFITILIWGTTFISTKVLLRSFLPAEILFLRFLLGFAALFLSHPRIMKWAGWEKERLFALAGLSGVCLYYLLENIALTYTMASNVGVIISAAPFFTALLSSLIYRRNRLGAGFLIGFLSAMIGIGLISFGSASLELNPLGDLLALLAALFWAVYSLAVRRISSWEYNTVQATRRIFLYGLIFMVPALFISGADIDIAKLSEPLNLLNMLFLGLGASALCFVTWNHAVKVLGAVKTSVYIYLVPVITVIASVIILSEPFTWLTAIGMALTLLGLAISSR